MNDAELVIRQMTSDDPATIAAVLRGTHLERDASRIERYLADVATGSREAVTAVLDGEVIGYGTLNWRPKYETFRSASIPEIQDVNVAPRARRRGVGSAILTELERRAATRATIVGIAVGLYRTYGAAQRLYVSRGYLPDGTGIWSGATAVEEGALVRADDDLVLYLTKALSDH